MQDAARLLVQGTDLKTQRRAPFDDGRARYALLYSIHIVPSNQSRDAKEDVRGDMGSTVVTFVISAKVRDLLM